MHHFREVCREIDGIRPDYEHYAAFCTFMPEWDECDDVGSVYAHSTSIGNGSNLLYANQPDWI